MHAYRTIVSTGIPLGAALGAAVHSESEWVAVWLLVFAAYVLWDWWLGLFHVEQNDSKEGEP